MLVPFSVVAALMAFLITYGEMQYHYSTSRQPMREAVRAAVFVLFVFLALSWLAIAVLAPGR